MALVGPSGGGKTTAASLIPRFWDATSGAVKVGGVDVRQIDSHVLMDQIALCSRTAACSKHPSLKMSGLPPQRHPGAGALGVEGRPV